MITPLFPSPEGSGEPRTAAAIIRRNALMDARTDAIVSGVACAGAIAIWIGFGHAAMRSGTFFLFGLALLWAGKSARAWWSLRTTSADPAVAAARRADELALAESVAQHRERIKELRPWMTFGLLACIATVGVSQLLAHGKSIEIAGLVKPATRAGEWWRLVSAAYMHVGWMHIYFNWGALLALGRITELYAPRTRVPLVFLASALAGTVSSLFLLPNTTSVGASGGIMGLAGYLLVLRMRRPEEIPKWIGTAMVSTIALTAYIGFFGLAYIDNAAHAGGAAMGALLGIITIPREGETLSPGYARALEILGWIAAAELVAGALMTDGILLFTRMH